MLPHRQLGRLWRSNGSRSHCQWLGWHILLVSTGNQIDLVIVLYLKLLKFNQPEVNRVDWMGMVSGLLQIPRSLVRADPIGIHWTKVVPKDKFLKNRLMLSQCWQVAYFRSIWTRHWIGKPVCWWWCVKRCYRQNWRPTLFKRHTELVVLSLEQLNLHTNILSGGCLYW